MVGAAGLLPEVCLLHLQPRTSISEHLFSKKLHCPHKGATPPLSSCLQPMSPACPSSPPLGLLFPFLSSHLLFILGPPPSTSESCGLWKGHKALAQASRSFTISPKRTFWPHPKTPFAPTTPFSNHTASPSSLRLSLQPAMPSPVFL